ncbi:MAG TPA: nuclear transport factor 2 family protein [Pseudonocardiaceae bacterium]|jgi:3-phenylpropionate/cinnamic acid dioxygenase small subunit
MTLDIDDRIAITDLIKLHGHHADDGDFDAMLSLFTENVVYDLTGVDMGVLVGYEQIRAIAKEIGDDNPVAHLVTNIVLRPIGPDEVHARSKGIAVMGNGRAGSATYDDVVIRTEAGWRISERRITARRVPLSGVHHQN